MNTIFGVVAHAEKARRQERTGIRRFMPKHLPGFTGNSTQPASTRYFPIKGLVSMVI
jgi:hypothetical protein